MPLYQRAGALVEFLVKYSQEEALTSGSRGLTWSNIQRLAVTMYEHDIIEREDVTLAQVGLKAVIAPVCPFSFEAQTPRRCNSQSLA